MRRVTVGLLAVTGFLQVSAPGQAREMSAATTPVMAATRAATAARLADRREAPDRAVLQRALEASACAAKRGVVDRPRLLTLIDYSRPSTEPRLWVLDLEAGTVLFHERVAHGQNSGGNQAVSFSNLPESRQSSLGLFVTANSYVGRNGYSLRLDGLEPGFNDQARARAIVIDGAPYVSDESIDALGRLGRSWGCPAVRPAVAKRLIDTIKNGSLVFAYYPEPTWLQASRFSAGCAAGAPMTSSAAPAP